MKQLLPLLILIFSLSGYGQTPFRFQSTLDTLPANYQGNSVIDIAKAISRLQGNDPQKLTEKGEFETSIDYAKRLEEYKKKLPVETVSNRFVLVKNYQLAEYDADSQILNVRTAFTHVEDGAVVLIDSDSQRGSYAATNAYGAIITVTTTSNSSYWIKFVPTSFPEPVVSQIKLDIPSAKSIKPNLRTLVYFELVLPYLESDITSEKATFSSPRESKNTTFRYLAKPLEIWFFDQVTGKVYFKKKF